MPFTNLIYSNDIERETGLSIDLLRKWRQRFGFPNYELVGDRARGYSRETVKQLLLIKQLLGAGFRPAQVVGKTLPELDRLCLSFAEEKSEAPWSKSIKDQIERLKRCDLAGLQNHLALERANRTVSEFVVSTLAPLINAVGEAWLRGEIEVFHEHLFSSAIQRYLHAELMTLQPKPGFPRVLFATVTDEHHSLGLLMTEAVFADQGVTPVNIGPNTPASAIRSAATALRADVVAVSFSSAYPSREIRPTLLHLRRLLPENIELWSGGAGVAVIRRPIAGVIIFANLEDAIRHVCGMEKRRRK